LVVGGEVGGDVAGGDVGGDVAGVVAAVVALLAAVVVVALTPDVLLLQPARSIAPTATATTPPYSFVPRIVLSSA